MFEKHKKFVKDARERVLTLAVEVSTAIAGVHLFVEQTGIGADEWQKLTAIGVVATALEVVKNLAARKKGDPDSGSLNSVDGDTDCVGCDKDA